MLIRVLVVQQCCICECLKFLLTSFSWCFVAFQCSTFLLLQWVCSYYDIIVCSGSLYVSVTSKVLHQTKP